MTFEPTSTQVNANCHRQTDTQTDTLTDSHLQAFGVSVVSSSSFCSSSPLPLPLPPPPLSSPRCFSLPVRKSSELNYQIISVHTASVVLLQYYCSTAVVLSDMNDTSCVLHCHCDDLQMCNKNKFCILLQQYFNICTVQVTVVSL